MPLINVFIYKRWFKDRGHNVSNGYKKWTGFVDSHPRITQGIIALASIKGGGRSFGPSRAGGGRTPLKFEISIQARQLGYSKSIPANKAPFNSHGQPVFQKGNQYITRDVDSHKGGYWKMIQMQNGRPNRLGTYDKNLNRIGD